MYLIFSSKETNKYLTEELNKLDIKNTAIDCVESTPNEEVINKLPEELKGYDILIITSPLTINYLQNIFSQFSANTTFIVAGQSSYNRIKQYTKNIILAPKINSGADAVISEILENTNLTNRKIAILRGINANDEIENYLNSKIGKNSYLSLIIYHQKYLDLDTEYIKKLLCSNHLQGIILTSSQHALHLVQHAQKFGYYDLLVKANFITLHTKIANILKNHGVNNLILVSKASNQSLIDLIGNLHDR